MSAQKADVAIIGGGIVGLATAYQAVRRFPGRKVVVRVAVAGAIATALAPL